MQKNNEQRQYNWPQVKYHGTPYQILVNNAKHNVRPVTLPQQHVSYLLRVCRELKVGTAIFQLTLSITARYITAKPNTISLQLVLLVSLLISCKFLERNPPELSTLHKLSCNSFTNRDFSKVEMTILNEIKFETIKQGIPTRELHLVLDCIKKLMKTSQAKIFPSIVADLQKLIWVYLYTGKIHLKQNQHRVINATIIHLSLVFITQYSGRFLQTLWACKLTEVQEKDVTTLGNRILKLIMGEEKGKAYKI